MEKSSETDLKLSLNSNEWQKYLDKHFKNNNRGETIKDVKMSNIPKENTATNKPQEKKHQHPIIIILLLILIIAFIVNTFEIYDLKQQIDELESWLDDLEDRFSWEELKKKKENEANSIKQSESSWEKYRKQQEDKEKQENISQEVEIMVWVGNTGTKYHKQSCRTLKGNGHQITMKQALAEGREACKVCY